MFIDLGSCPWQIQALVPKTIHSRYKQARDFTNNVVRLFLFMEQIECSLMMPSTTSQPYIVELQLTSVVVTCRKIFCRGLPCPLYDVLVMFERLTCKNPITSVEFCNLVWWKFNCSCLTNLLKKTISLSRGSLPWPNPKKIHIILHPLVMLGYRLTKYHGLDDLKCTVQPSN